MGLFSKAEPIVRVGNSWAVWVLAVVLPWGVGSARADETIQLLEAPCINSTNATQIQQLKAPGSQQAGQRTCEQMMKDFLSSFDQRISNYAKAWYQGCDQGLNQESGAAPGVCQGSPVPGRTCNMLSGGVPGVFNQGRVEKEVNHLGHSCGDWPTFQTKMGKRVCSITPNYALTRNYIEDAYNRGAWIQSLNCFYSQVKNELNQKRLRITSNGNLPMAQFVQQAKEKSAGISEKMKANYTGQANIVDVDQCKGTEVAQGNDPGRLRQSACQLSAARLSQEAMFFQLAAAEVFSRARHSYEKFLGGNPTQDTVTATVREAMQNKDGKPKDCDGRQALENWYKPKYFEVFQQRAQQFWNPQSCQ